MTCSDLVQRLFSYAGRTQAIKGLSNMRRIDAWQGHLHRRFATVHIAGTNGKGSVTLKIASALSAQYKKVGLYTSPHISSFRERIQVNESMIPEEFALQFLPKLFAFIEKEKIEPSFFDLLTALAFEYFASQEIDIAVLEVGLGGEFDATNVVLPQLSVITSIAFDHVEVLGPTLDDIARAKAGIIKEGVPVVVGPHARLSPILNAAKGNIILSPEAPGFYDDENNAIARAALEKLNIPEKAIAAGLLRRPPCRFEIVDDRPIILDVAHNPDGFIHLRAALDAKFPNIPFHVILAIGKEKDPAECMGKIGSRAHRIACLSNNHPRLADARDVLRRLQMNGFSNAYLAASVEEVLRSKDPILVCGSFFIMNDVLSSLRSRAPKKERERPVD